MRLLSVLALTALVACRGEGYAEGAAKDRAAPGFHGIEGLVSRVVGAEAAALIDFVDMPATRGDQDAFRVTGGGPGANVTIAGSSPVAMASGLRSYLRDAANCSVGWGGRQLHALVRQDSSGSAFLPAVAGTIQASTPMKWRQWGNVVVHSYSAAFWDFARWEQELDLMAMRGYNLALGFTGQEAIWASVWKGFGLTEDDLEPFFTGPAFLAWGGPRMGNIRGWQGPLPEAWRQGQLALGRRLVARMRDLGITAALPMFAGHVPMALARRYPEANISQSSAWAGFNCTYSCVGLLLPNKPLFAEVVSRTVSAFREAFGESLPCLGRLCDGRGDAGPGPLPGHVWQFDMYNELLPSSNASGYLKEQANATYAPLAAADPGAVWLLQGWMFSFSIDFWVPRAIQAYLSGVPQDSMLILDLDAYLEPLWRKTDGFYGRPFLWGIINDGGQRPGLFGNVTRVRTGPAEAQAAKPQGMQGVSFSPEGINVNPMLYDFLADVVWSELPPGGDEAWVRRYATARYGLDLAPPAGAAAAPRPPASASPAPALMDRTSSEELAEAWTLLLPAVYNQTEEWSGSLVERFPIIGSAPDYGWCDTQSLASAWRLVLSAVQRTVALRGPSAVSPLLLFDAVDIARQVTVNTAGDLAGLLTGASLGSRAESADAIGARVARLMTLLNGTLSAHPAFSLASWVEPARQMCGGYGGAALEARCVENALWQVTLWGALEPQDAGTNLDTYAAKQWAGMIPLYADKWAALASAAGRSARAGDSVNNTAVVEEMVELTVKWVADTTRQGPAAVPGPDPAAFVASAGAFAAEFGGDEAVSLARFERIEDADADGQIARNQTGTRDPAQIAAVCLSDPACGGFNADGWLKAKGAKRVPFPGSTLWVLKQA